MKLSAAFTAQESTPKAREQIIVLPKVRGDAVSILVDFVSNDFTEIMKILGLALGQFKISFEDKDLVSNSTAKNFYDASFNHERGNFFYARYENEVIIYTLRLNIFDISIDYLQQYRGKQFVLTINQ